MNKVTLYIAKTISIAILLTMLLFVGLEFIFSLVNEIRHVGTGSYHTESALMFILLSTPQHIAEIFPMASLVGSLIGLGLLASRSELIVMQAAGFGLQDIIIAVLKLAAVLAACIWLLGEWVAPFTDKMAHQQKALALSSGQALGTLHGTWLRDGNDFVHIQRMVGTGHLEGITRYEFDDNMKMKKASFARFADYSLDHWELHDIQETLFEPKSISKKHSEKLNWKSAIQPSILSIVGVKDLDGLSLTGLWQTLRYRHANHLDTKPFELALWQKLVRPFATLVMMFIAIPFIFGPLRSATMGLRMLVGVLAGFTFFTFNQLFGPLTLVYHLPPVIGAWLPTLLFLGVGLGILKRTH